MSETHSGFTSRQLDDPQRVEVRDGDGWVATFTVGSRTVTLRGPTRTFAESTTDATVETDTWVRLLEEPFAGAVDRQWLRRRLADRSPDILAMASEYLTGAPTVVDADGRVVAGDAAYGPETDEGSREEGSDFNDFLGQDWDYPAVEDSAEVRQLGSLDCSGFVRMVFGYRGGLPVTYDPDGVRLPRRSFQMLASAPGVVIEPDRGEPPEGVDRLIAGDLVFFDADEGDGDQIDHVGIYLGVDSEGSPRFLSSRKTVNGPTLGDVGGDSTLDGDGLYAEAWRAARRL